MLDPLMSTKLGFPKARTNLVARPHLIEKLDQEPENRLTLVSAPAGFGKTTLLVEWLEGRAGDGVSVAWLSLDEGDNDPARFVFSPIWWPPSRPSRRRSGRVFSPRCIRQDHHRRLEH